MTTSEAIALCESQGLLQFPDANRPQKSAPAIKQEIKRRSRFYLPPIKHIYEPSQVGEVRRYIVYPK